MLHDYSDISKTISIIVFFVGKEIGIPVAYWGMNPGFYILPTLLYSNVI